MRVAIYGKVHALASPDTVNSLLSHLQAIGAHIAVFADLQALVQHDQTIGLFSTAEEVATYDYLISIGGDGTLLNATTLVRNSGIPILGINMGRLGFLTDCGKDDIAEAVKALADKSYQIDRRTVLKIENAESNYGGYPFALNELTVHKKDTSSMVTVNVFMNDVFLNSYWADGLIIATPTGSTAYSLSCGGPILTPESENIVLTPIAPHNLNVRPLVIPDDSKLRLEVQSRSNDFLASPDSRSEGHTTAAIITISKADFTINLLRRPGQDFLSTLRSKLMWGIDKRNY